MLCGIIEQGCPIFLGFVSPPPRPPLICKGKMKVKMILDRSRNLLRVPSRLSFGFGFVFPFLDRLLLPTPPLSSGQLSPENRLRTAAARFPLHAKFPFTSLHLYGRWGMPIWRDGGCAPIHDGFIKPRAFVVGSEVRDPSLATCRGERDCDFFQGKTERCRFSMGIKTRVARREGACDLSIEGRRCPIDKGC